MATASDTYESFVRTKLRERVAKRRLGEGVPWVGGGCDGRWGG